MCDKLLWPISLLIFITLSEFMSSNDKLTQTVFQILQVAQHPLFTTKNWLYKGDTKMSQSRDQCN